jgi:hypothetical protein
MKKLLAFLLFFAPSVLPAQVPAGFVKLSNVAVLTYTDATCPDLTTCEYFIVAVDASGVESAGASCAALQLCVNGNIVVAQMPSSGVHTVTLSWGASPTTGVTYNVYSHAGPLPATNAKSTVN